MYPEKEPEPLDPTLVGGTSPEAEPAGLGEATLVRGPASDPPTSPGGLLGAPDPTLVDGGAPPDATLVGAAAGPDATLVGGAAPAPGAAPGGLVPGTRFELLATLGVGGMGKVFRARDRHIEGRMVALKVLHPRYSHNARFRELFFQEIRASQKFVSEHAVQIRDTGQLDDGSLFLTMDLVAGESLARKLRREGALAPEQAFEITRQILLGLQGGHEQGLVHRDIKPSNVMLAARVPKTEGNPHGVGVRLLDFGIAGLVEDQPTGELTGTPTYMSPEQVQGQRLDARSDLFAVGVVLYEMVAGTRPFEGETLEHVETSILETQIEPLIRDLENLPRPVKKILTRALRKDREKRYQSAAEFLHALERARIARPRGQLGLLAKSTMALLAATAGALAMLFVSQRTELEELRGRIEATTEEATRSNEAEIAALNLRLTQKETELTRLQERLSEKGDADTRFFDLERDYTRLREDHAALQRRNEELARRATELESARLEGRPDASTAACFDEVLRRIDHGAGRSALELLQSQAASGVFALANLDGRDLVYRLATAAAALESADRPEGVDLGLLEVAGGLLERTRAEAPDFPRQAASWLAFTTDAKSPVDRAATLERTLAALETSLAALQERGASTQDATWRAVLAGPDDQHPGEAFEHAALYGPTTIVELVARYAAHLERSVVASGRLDVARLAEEDALAHWGPWLAGPGAVLADEAADTVRTFHCAREWYVDRSSDPAFAELLEASLASVEETPRTSWRAQLALQIALAQSESAYPLAREASAVMRHVWIESGATMWFLERPGEVAADRWVVERRIHDVDGNTTGRPQTYTITRQADTFYTEGIKGLDLRSADGELRVGSFVPPRASVLPERPWVRGLDRAGYDQRVGTDPLPCLVVQNGSTELWFSPRLGLVREKRAGVYERELVFFSALR